MSVDDTTSEAEPSGPETPADRPELTQAQTDAMDRAVKYRIEGGRRPVVFRNMTRAGITAEHANSVIDAMDEVMFSVNGIRHTDVSAEVDAKIAIMQAENPREVRAPMTKKPEVLVREATGLARRGKTKAEVVAYLQANGAGEADAKKVAGEVADAVRSARADFERSKTSAKNMAVLRIVLGVVILIISIGLISSGAESSGRRTPTGAFLTALAIIGSGIYEFKKASDQTY